VWADRRGLGQLEMNDTETVKAFIDRMLFQDPSILSEKDMRILMSLALIGAQELIRLNGDDVRVPNAG